MITKHDLESRDPIWLLDVTLAGQVYRFASETIDVTRRDGVTLRYDGQLEIDYSQDFDLFSDSPSRNSASFALIFPFSVPDSVTRGLDLSAGSGSLSIWIPGKIYEDRQVILSGDIQDPEYGEEDEPVSFTIESRPYDDTSLIPPRLAEISPYTWETPDGDDVDGTVYPVVFGRPGFSRSGAGAIAYHPASPAYIVDDTLIDQVSPTPKVVPLIACGYECDGGYVTVWDATDSDAPIADTSQYYQISHMDDGMGRRVAVVLLDTSYSSRAVRAQAGHSYWITWRYAAGIPAYVTSAYTTGAGGILLDDRSASIEGAGDLIEWLLTRSSFQVDRGRIAASKPFLNSYRLAGYFDEHLSPWSYIQDVLSPILPMTLVSGPDGVYPLVWRMDATASDAIHAFTEGSDFQRDSSIRNERKDIFNEIELKFALDASTDTYHRTVIITGDDTDDTISAGISSTTRDYITQYQSLYCRVSNQRYGSRRLQLQTDVVYDDITAQKIVNWLSRYHCFPSRSVDYVTPPRCGWLRPGDIVTITDPKVSLNSQLAIVKSMSWSVDQIRFSFLLLHDPVRDRKV